MATRERLDTGPDNFDEGFGSSPLDDNFGMGAEQPDDRKPAKPLRKGAYDALKGHLTDPRQIRNYVGKTMPKQYGELYDGVDTFATEMKSAMDDVRQQAQGPINQLARNLKNKVPKRFKRVQKVLNKIDNATASQDWGSGPNAEKEMADRVSRELQDTFGEYVDRMQEDKDEREAIEADRYAREFLRGQTQNDLLARISRNSDHQTRFYRGVQMPFMKKSVELQYRIASGVGDLVKLTSGMMQQQKRQLDMLIRTSGLPDVQKMRLSENYKQTIRNKFIDSTLGGFKGGNMITQMTKTLTDNIRDTVSMALMGVDAANNGMESQQFMEEMEEDQSPEGVKRRRAQQLSGAVLGVMPNVAGGISRKAMRKMPKVTRGVFRGARALGYGKDNMHSVLQDYAYGNPLARDGFLRDLVAMMLPSRDTAGQVNMARGKDLREATHYDNASRRALVDVIPGLLGRILQEQQIARTGDLKTQRLNYNYDKGRFEAQSESLRGLRAQTHRSGTPTQEAMKEILEDLKKSGIELDAAQSTDLTKALVRGRKSGRTMTQRSLSSEQFYKNIVGDANAPALAKAMRAYLHTNEYGTFTNAKKGERNRGRLFGNLANADDDMTNIRALIQDLFDRGQGDVAYAAGWMKEDGTINVQRVMDAMAGVDDSTGPGSDGTVPGGFAPGRPPSGGKPPPTINSPYASTRFVLPASSASVPRKAAPRPVPHETPIGSDHSRILELVTSFHADTNQRLDKVIEKLDQGPRFSFGGFGSGPQAVPAEKGPDFMGPMPQGLFDRLRGRAGAWMDQARGNRAAVEEDEAGEEQSNGLPGFWKRNIREHGEAAFGFLQRNARRAGIIGGKADRALRRRLFGENVGYIQGTKEAAQRSRLVGARRFKDFKDGLPAVGTVYIDGVKDAIITARQLASGTLTDSTGKVITTLADLVNSTGDILDEAGEIVMTRAELAKTYVKANGEIIRDVWADRIARASRNLKDMLTSGVSNLIAGGLRTRNMARTFARKSVFAARSVFTPPVDVYVRGEEGSGVPRLYAYLMKAGGYFNQIDESVIQFPIQIKGPVMDADGNILIKPEDLVKGLCDVEGKPFRTIGQKLLARAQTNARKLKKFAGQALSAAGQALRTTGRLAGTFMTRGLRGVMSGTWKNGYKSANITAGEGGDCCENSFLVLSEIRDILLSELPARKGWGGAGKGKGRGKADPKPAPTPYGGNTNINNPREAANDAAPAASSGRMNSIDQLTGLAGGAIKGAASAGMGLLRRLRRKGRKGGADAEELVGPVQPKPEAAKAAKEESATKRSMGQMFRTLAGKIPAFNKAAPDTSDMRKGSVEERNANWRNINAPTKTLADVVQPEQQDRKNTIDLIIDAVKKTFGGAKDAVGNAADLLDDLPDGDDRKRGRRGRGRGRMGKAARAGQAASRAGQAAEVAKAAGKKPGIFSRAMAAGGRGLSSAGKFLLGDVGGAGGRAGAAARFGTAAWAATRFLGKRVLAPIAAGIAGVLGAPVVGTAIMVGGALWGAKELYDLLSDNPKSKDNRHLEAIRMAEYGFSPEDRSACAKMLQLEEFLKDAAKETDGKMQLDKTKIEVEPLFKLFGINPEDNNQISKFISWFNGRFKPNYLKWLTISRAVGKNLAALEDMDSAQRLKVLQATDAGDGWDMLDNPFGGQALKITGRDVRNLRKAATSFLEKESKKTDKDGKPIVESMSEKEMVRTTLRSAQAQSTEGNKATEDFRKLVANDPVQKFNNSRKMANFTSDGAKRLQSGNLTILQSIRLRMYGYAQPNMGNVIAVRGCEEEFAEDIVVNDSGSGVYNGDLNKAWDNCAKYFGMSPNDDVAKNRWQTWVQQRFLPVFTTFRGQLKFRAGQADEGHLERVIDGVSLYEMAQAIAGVAVWNYTVMPLANQAANTDPKTVENFLDTLRDQANSQKAREVPYKKPPMSDAARADQNMSAMQFGMRTDRTAPIAQMIPTKAQEINTMPDVEKPPSSAGSQSSPVKAPPSVGALPNAGGDLASGGSGWNYIKAPSKDAIEGLNPEVKRLFLAMAEEYGELTQQKIQVNRGFVTFEQQQKEYANDPKKAAPPGSSNHEFGLALDINTVDMNRLDKLGLLRKYGFTRPIGGETWHMEPAGIQHDIRGLRMNPDAAAKAVAAGVGKGGGGVGATKGGFRFGGRDTNYALQIQGASDTKPEKDGNVSVSAPRAGGGQGGFAGQIDSNRNTLKTSSSAPINTSGGSSGTPGAGPGPTTAGGAGQGLYASLPGASSKDEAKILVDKSAQGVGIDPKIAMMTTAMESGFRVNASASTSSATGLKQFTSGTWKEMMGKYAQEYGIPSGTSASDPKANAILGARYLKDNLEKAGKNGLPQDVTTAYLMHLLGTSGGQKALKLPDDADMVKAFPDSAPANKPTFYNADGSPRTKAQFIQNIQARMQKAANDFGIDLPQGSMAPTSSSAPKARPVATSAPAPARAPVQSSGGGFGRASSTPTAPTEAFQSTPVSAARPASSGVEKEMLDVLKSGTTIAEQQLDVQRAIHTSVNTLIEMLNERQANKPQAPAASATPVQEPSSRAERATRQVTPPMYRTA